MNKDKGYKVRYLKYGHIEVEGVRIYPPKNHLPVWGTCMDEDGNVFTSLTFTYQEPYTTKFRYTDPDGKVHETVEKEKKDENL